MKEKIFYEMISLVKIFSFLILVSSIVVITIRVCETTKRDFKLKNIFRFNDEKKVNKKSKKEIKNLKDFKIHYVDGNNQANLMAPPLIHTLMPLPLPVHLPLPSHSDSHLLENHQNHPDHDNNYQPNHPDHHPINLYHPDHHHHDHPHPEDPYPHHNHLEHDHIHAHPPPHTFPVFQPEHLAHFHANPDLEHMHPPNIDSHSHQMPEQSGPLLPEASMIRPIPHPIIIHQQFNPIPTGVSEHIPERIAYPVFELVDNRPKKAISKTRVRSYSDSYGKTRDSFETDFDNESDYDNRNHLNDNKKRVPKMRKTSQTTARLVNNKKFNTINNINTNFDEFFDEEKSDLRKSNESDKYSDQKQSDNQKSDPKGNELNASDNKIDEKRLPSVEVVPDEQIVNVVEDEWTFKDLDLWIIR